MKVFRCTILSLLITVTINTTSYAQVEVDSAYINYINEAWSEIKEIEDDEGIQKNYASEFYKYYLDHEDTEAGKKQCKVPC